MWPHRTCIANSFLVWVHVGADVAIGLAYVVIATELLAVARGVSKLWRPVTVAIAYLDRKLSPSAPTLGWFLSSFTLFILLCGTTHLFGALEMAVPVYTWSAVDKVLTAGVSWHTALRLVPAFRHFPRPARPANQANRGA